MPDEPIYNAIEVDNPLDIFTQFHTATDTVIYEQLNVTDSSKRANGRIQGERFTRHFSCTTGRKNIS